MEILIVPDSGYPEGIADLRHMSESAQDQLVISVVKVDEVWVVVNRFGDDEWRNGGYPTNISKSNAVVSFNKIPQTFRRLVKEVTYAYMMRGRERTRRPTGNTVKGFVKGVAPFIKYLDRLGVNDVTKIPAIVFANYAHECRSAVNSKNKPIGKASIAKRLMCVETLHELSYLTGTPFQAHPWPDSSALALAQLTGSSGAHRQESLTPLIPDDVFSTMFEKAHQVLLRGDYLLDIRDDLDVVSQKKRMAGHEGKFAERNKVFSKYAYDKGIIDFQHEVKDIRVACYIVIASTSGCRNHEIFNLQTGCHHKTVGDDGEIYHWMRSLSEKTNAGVCDWMIPAVAVRALRLMERWAVPYQSMIAKEIIQRRKLNPLDPEISDAKKHLNSIFLGVSNAAPDQARTLSVGSCNKNLQSFSQSIGLEWNFTSHQFRRKFANYVAHSKFGDLRYLKEHFKHWSLDMTLTYAMDESWGNHFDLDLFSEIEAELAGIKTSMVDGWINEGALSGGYGRSIKAWVRDPVNLAIFKDHKTMVKSIAESTSIRSNGHAWCTADDTGCVGNTFERSRCGGCDNAVIGKEHAHIYRGLYSNLSELLACEEIGESGLSRVKRDLARYSTTLNDLGVTLESSDE